MSNKVKKILSSAYSKTVSYLNPAFLVGGRTSSLNGLTFAR